jgi:hypothetical protein
MERGQSSRNPRLRNPHDRGDVHRIFNEVKRHWLSHWTLSSLALVLSNYLDHTPPRPFSFVLVNSQPTQIMLVFTTWHDDDDVLRFWDAEVMSTLFAAKQFVLDDLPLVVTRGWSNLIEAGPRYVDENGVMPYILRSDFHIDG